MFLQAKIKSYFFVVQFVSKSSLHLKLAYIYKFL
jgi:hypothetical protein